MKKTIAFFGGSSKVGGKTIEKLLISGHCVTSFERKKRFSNRGEKQVIIDFNNLQNISFEGDTAIVTIGTTRAKAGSTEAFVKVDYELVKNIAIWAKKQGINEFHVISSLGATENANGLYLQTKFKMEQAITELGFEKLCIYRPSLYADLDRKPIRIKEFISIPVLSLFALLSEKNLIYRPIYTDIVATRIAKSINEDLSGNIIFKSNDIYKVGAISFFKQRKKEQKLLIQGIISFLGVWGLIELFGFSSLFTRISALFLICAFLFLWIKSVLILKKGALGKKEEHKKNNRSKAILRLFIWTELMAIMSCLVFGYLPIAILVFILLIFDVMFFYNIQDYLNGLKQIQ
ncbi:hypothetical protein FVB32_10285 [Flagellimonas hymeniacidonis]|uniref:NAD(P)-binding domain-containing protein n=1 Tax=Flagellimonas hymeniacidonis TaxID=2603628 RepID=A0A5C8V0X3_9FLAO|nr:hypothetical protein [Flagellimonas hymeniacidonis]TXN34976.1 hypothetical protein FVB32_10285 [Flagellimonas hymeniacidonis]